MNSKCHLSASSKGTGSLEAGDPSRKKILHLARSSKGKLLSQVVNHQLTQNQVILVLVDAEGGTFRAVEINPCIGGIEANCSFEAEEIGYSELLDLLLEVDRVFVW